MANIQPRCRLIQQHDGRFLRQHHGYPRPLTLAAGRYLRCVASEVIPVARLAAAWHLAAPAVNNG